MTSLRSRWGDTTTWPPAAVVGVLDAVGLGLIRDLVAMGQGRPMRPVLFPTDDEHVEAVCRHLDVLAEHFAVPGL